MTFSEWWSKVRVAINYILGGKGARNQQESRFRATLQDLHSTRRPTKSGSAETKNSSRSCTPPPPGRSTSSCGNTRAASRRRVFGDDTAAWKVLTGKYDSHTEETRRACYGELCDTKMQNGQIQRTFSTKWTIFKLGCMTSKRMSRRSGTRTSFFIPSSTTMTLFG